MLDNLHLECKIYIRKEDLIMSITYINRSLEPVLKQAVSEFPAVVLTGPRQSGKTTLLQHLFIDAYRYISLEPPDVRAAAIEDPRSFLEMNPPPVIFDEIQYAPDLLPFIKEMIDEDRLKAGQFLLTGSQNLLLMEKVTESLAGRAAMLTLLPLSRREIDGEPQSALPWESYRTQAASSKKNTFGDLWKTFLRGGYPELIANPDRDANLWFGSFVRTYLERDVRMLRQVGDLTLFQNFLRALAARSGQLLNLSDVSRDLGVSVNTAKAWISVLEATFQIIVLRPYYASVGKQLVKTPKIYFTDTGILCYLTGLKDPEHAFAGPMGGAIMETAVLIEIVKTYMSRGISPRIYFWRTRAGTEVDIVVETEGKLVPVEVKLSATPRSAMASGIKAFQADMGNKALKGYVVHPGNVILPLGSFVTALPFADL
jgi:predicted AAA+ superfamily ATPase